MSLRVGRRGPIPAALLHACPSCGAARGVWCVGSRPGALAVVLHLERATVEAQRDPIGGTP